MLVVVGIVVVGCREDLLYMGSREDHVWSLVVVDIVVFGEKNFYAHVKRPIIFKKPIHIYDILMFFRGILFGEEPPSS